MPTTSRPARAAGVLRSAALAGVLAATLAACGGAAAGEETSVSDLTDVALVYDRALTVCTDIPYAPFEFKKDGVPVGFDIDVIERVAARLGVQLDVLDVSFDDIVSGTSLNARTCDVAISAISITGERARVVDFSSPYFDAQQTLVTPTADGVSDLSQLGGARIGVQAGTTGETYLSDFAPSSSKIVPFPDAGALEDALASGSVDAAVYDNTAVAPVLKNNPSVEIAKEYDTGEQYGIAVEKDGNIALLRTINDVLTEMRKSGDYDKIYKTWFKR